MSSQATRTGSQAHHTNRLARETSPYLLQHAQNPVDWRAWGEEAFRAAREADKPIFLSVGYSTCYWCHVMERESFESEAVAAVLNEHFVPIKVDREERPDVDDLYMTAVQLMTRQGGWPMSVWLEPERLRPFYAGTYFPPQDRHGLPSFTTVLRSLAEAWSRRRDDVMKQADQVSAAVVQVVREMPEAVTLDAAVVRDAVSMQMRTYDANHGGFGGAPKFPTPVNLDLLMECAWEDETVRNAVLHTLDRMARGGMYDQVGGGFHRYSVDAQWLVPHFEKMLYDNGQLLTTYARAHEKTGDPYFERILRQTAAYVEREMMDKAGGFYSAQDAEVDAREGLNYLWVEDEVRAALGEAGFPPDEIGFALEVYGLSRGTNFQDPHHSDEPPRNVLTLTAPPAELAEAGGMSVPELFEKLDRINAALLKVRDQREQPGTDDKVLTGWNGLMMAGLADAGRALKEPKFIELAERAARFIEKTMRTEDDALARSYRKGEARIPAFLEDYALLMHGLLALHAATDDSEHLERARALATEARELFVDKEAGGAYFDSRPEQTDLFVRSRSRYDGAIPSGNSVMANNLITLAERTGERVYFEQAAALLRYFSSLIREQSLGLAGCVRALHRLSALEPDLFAAELSGAQSGAVTSETGGPVRIKASAVDSRTVDIEMSIQSGFHINARDPGQPALVPLLIEAAGGTPSIEVEAPEPSNFGPEESPARGYAGLVTFTVKLSEPMDRDRPPRLFVTYQACTETECHAPRTEVVTVSP
ncbi:MAG: DUF255 domain-containing protein [Phycisphaerales bacterium]|nr:MAG: DUF255 domain-containing protein [Phycisphaerales bacterium]